jgi:4'-phosphopantetheinyl transferase
MKSLTMVIAPTTHFIWSEPPAKPTLSPHEVHIWCARVEVPAFDFARLQGLLSSDESARAADFRFERDRHRFVAAHAFLRTILSLYLDCCPTELDFKYTEYGKPSLVNSQVDSSLSFNMAHSGEVALYAIALERAIGLILNRFARNSPAKKSRDASSLSARPVAYSRFPQVTD